MTEEDAALRTQVMTDSKPLLVLLQHNSGSTEFWTQQEVLTDLRSELMLITGVSEDLGTKDVDIESTAPTQELAKKRSWFSRASKPASSSTFESSSEATSEKVQVNCSEIYVRRESAVGLLTTVTIQAFLVNVVLA